VKQRKQFKQTFNSKRNELPEKVRRRIHILCTVKTNYGIAPKNLTNDNTAHLSE